MTTFGVLQGMDPGSTGDSSVCQRLDSLKAHLQRVCPVVQSLYAGISVDMLTKQLPAEKHWRYAQSMGLNKPPDKAKLTIKDDFKDDSDIYDA